MKLYHLINKSLSIAGLGLLVLSTPVFLSNVKAQESSESQDKSKANDAVPVAPAVPKETTDLIARAKKVIKHWYELRLRALTNKHKFDSDKAWEEAAKKGDFDDHDDFEKKISAQRKSDKKHFAELYKEMKKEVEKAHREELSKALKSDS